MKSDMKLRLKELNWPHHYPPKVVKQYYTCKEGKDTELHC